MDDDWLKKMWCVQMTGSSSAVGTDESLPFATTQMDLGNTLLSEISLTEKAKNYMISIVGGIEN